MLKRYSAPIRTDDGTWRAKVPAGAICRHFEFDGLGWNLIYDMEEDDPEGGESDDGL